MPLDAMEAPTLDRRLVAILAADVEGYSRLMAMDEEAALATLSAYRTVADDLIGTFHGRIANTAGDSVLAEFASVVDAVRCAIELQAAIARANAEQSDEQRMLFRIGINVGDVMVKDGDIFGDGVNIAARLQTLAEAGGICVSRGVRDHSRHLGSFRFEDLGEQMVKNIERPVRAFRVVPDAGMAPGTGPAPEGLASGPLEADAAALDLALWQAVAESDRVAELLRYLERFPAGEFAALARTRIAALSEARKPAPAAALDARTTIELTFWESVQNSDSRALYEAYLEKYPAGEFALIARAKLDELD
jgi:class 3 adenylate cyclase